jgi:hypothetical protein
MTTARLLLCQNKIASIFFEADGTIGRRPAGKQFDDGQPKLLDALENRDAD